MSVERLIPDHGAHGGFELFANAAEDVADPGRTLTRAYYISVLFVIALYVLVAIVSVGSTVSSLVGARDYALAEAARSAPGTAGLHVERHRRPDLAGVGK